MANGNYQPTQQMPAQGQHAQPQYQQQYQQYPPRQISFDKKATSTGQWMLTLFLVCIPVVNIILLLVWAFSSSTERSKKNWARANIIWAIIGIVVTIALLAIGSAMGIDWNQVLSQYTQRY